MSLCLDCGCALCCDGTLFSKAELQKQELPFLDKQFAVVQSPASNSAEPLESFFNLPCKMCKNDCCSIHAQERPSICGNYRCQLLVGHQQGKVSTEEALKLVNEVKSLRDRLRPQMEGFTGSEKKLPFKHLLKLTVEKLEKTEAMQLPRVYQEMSLNIAVLHILLVKNFDSSLSKIHIAPIMQINSPERHRRRN